MDDKLTRISFPNKQEDDETAPENSGDSPRSDVINDGKIVSVSTPKRSRRAIQKRVVSVPIRDVEGCRIKGEIGTPPYDSWAWRKYGQKPIKGSPYPRGYYRCSSSKGCPARKQVERSSVDPTMILITYSCEHNHPWPATKNNHRHHHNTIAVTSAVTTNVTVSNSDNGDTPIFANQIEAEPDESFPNLGDESLITGDGTWYSQLELSASSTMLDSPILGANVDDDADMAMVFPTTEVDESLFADLGELPECSVVFRRGVWEREEEVRRRYWCGIN
ncbi:probable WRKY transcription factor 65 [Cornus florida]|uniref:probable WRKY transcription factor 65 n=1 Tax=Cornus florida TaxID=4283 RepID=UPI0028A02C29|nr:probable WRKY transcription factor 65 [Cornus florida]